MKKNLKLKFESLDKNLFEPLSDQQLSNFKGGLQTTSATMPTYYNGTTTADTVTYDDSSKPDVWA